MSDSRLKDLSLLILFVLGAAAVLLVPGVPWQLEWAFGIPLVLVAPGYTIVAALFPTNPSSTRAATGQPEPPGLAARAALTLTASAVVVAVVGVGLSSAEMLRLESVVLGLGGVSIAGAAIAGVRRRRLPVSQRANPLAAVSQRSIPDRLGLSSVQTVVFLVATLALVGALVLAGSSPAPESSFSEMSLLAGNDTDEFIGADEPVTLVDGEPNTMHLRLTNREGESVNYTVVGRIQRVGSDGSVWNSQRLGVESLTVEDGESVDFEQRVDTSMSDDTFRLQYLVYMGPVPDDPRPETAELSLRHWVETVEGDSA